MQCLEFWSSAYDNFASGIWTTAPNVPHYKPCKRHNMPVLPMPSTQPAPRRQRGASMVEFVLVALPLLLIGLAIVEIGYALMTRQVLRLVLHEAARAGVVQHGEPDVMAAALAAALTPLFVPAGRYASAQARMQASHAHLLRETGLPLWRLDILGPTAAAYQDFGRPADAHGGRLAIGNDYLAEQHGRYGVGPQSGLSIFDANVLHLRLTYLRAPVTPVTGALFKAAALAASDAARPALAAGVLPLTLEARMTMQSDPVAWRVRSISAAQQEWGPE